MDNISLDQLNVLSFIENLSQEIGEDAAMQVLETAKDIFKFAPNIDEEKRILGLLYGLVQSGKTNIINMTAALAIDNKYKLVIILTDRNNSLQIQTLDRSEDALQTPLIRKISNIDKNDLDLVKTMLLSDGLVIVSKKDPSDLEKLHKFLNEEFSDIDLTNTPTLIVDDEADAIGLNTNQRIEGSDNSPINESLIELKEKFNSHLMLQVTATPQAIILQNNEPNGFYPEFTIVSKAGEGYVGIDEFFLSKNNKNYIRNVNPEEIKILIEQTLDDNPNLPSGLLESLNTFIVATAIKILEDPGCLKNQFSYLCHISPYQDVHERLKVLVKRYLAFLVQALKVPRDQQTRDRVLANLSKAYDDLSKTYCNTPDFSTVLETINQNITSHEVSIVNSSPEGVTDLQITKKFNFIIGGNRLNRGITIPRLLVTYYGRYSNRPQVDTLFQHARMCGYRAKDLNVTRIFIPQEIASIFSTISEHDIVQRQLIDEHGLESILYLENNVVKPTRPNVIPKAVGVYKPGKSTFSILPEYRKEKVEHITSYIDSRLDSLSLEEILTVDINLVSDILLKIPSIMPGSWNEGVINSFLTTYYANKSRSINLIINKADIGKSSSRGSSSIGSILSPTIQEIVRFSDPKIPLLILTKNPGTKSEWDNTPFWMPWFRFPTNELPIIFNFGNF
ncbi:Z1 domain-containing protein [Lysinibacillus agricola]|uniref:Z1 domain-containing protein n=1 Tax=Lysinibacillus agricola TaxID=2590012 RepID=UPI003C268860